MPQLANGSVKSCTQAPVNGGSMIAQPRIANFSKDPFLTLKAIAPRLDMPYLPLMMNATF